MKKIILYLIFLLSLCLFVSCVSAYHNVVNTPDSGTEVNNPQVNATQSWSNEMNILSVDNLNATCIKGFGTIYSEFLYSSDYDFNNNLSSTDTLKGILVLISRRATLSNYVIDWQVYLTNKTGAIVGENKALDTSFNYWSTTKGDAYYGGSSDLWGTTTSNLSMLDVLDSDFGIKMSVKILTGGSGSYYAQVDCITIIIYCSSKPINSNNQPINNTLCISMPCLFINISDYDGDYMNQTFNSNISGAWQILEYNNHTLNSTLSFCPNTVGNKTFYWSSNVTDNNYNHWDNDTYYFYIVKVPSTNITIYNNHINTTWEHEYYYNFNDGFILYDNDTGNNTFGLYLFENILNATGFHNYTINSTGYTVFANYTGNCSNISFDPNATDVWLYLGAMLTLDNGQFFLLILIGLWSYFIYLFYREKEVIFAFCIICCGLPLGIILSGVAYYNSYPFGYLISFILIIISFLIPTYSMYQKNKKKKK